jgi:hypothetical protein
MPLRTRIVPALVPDSSLFGGGLELVSAAEGGEAFSDTGAAVSAVMRSELQLRAARHAQASAALRSNNGSFIVPAAGIAEDRAAPQSLTIECRVALGITTQNAANFVRRLNHMSACRLY